METTYQIAALINVLWDSYEQDNTLLSSVTNLADLQKAIDEICKRQGVKPQDVQVAIQQVDVVYKKEQ